jgi:hypothetical protein
MGFGDVHILDVPGLKVFDFEANFPDRLEMFHFDLSAAIHGCGHIVADPLQEAPVEVPEHDGFAHLTADKVVAFQIQWHRKASSSSTEWPLKSRRDRPRRWCGRAPRAESASTGHRDWPWWSYAFR